VSSITHDEREISAEQVPPAPEQVPLAPLLDDVKELAFDALHRQLAEEGHPAIRRGHGCVFRYLDVEGSRLTDLAERAQMSKQAVGEFVADLERLGYVERVPDPGDRRAKIIRLSPRGSDARQAALRIFSDIEREWAKRVGEERVAALRDTLETIIGSERAPVS
jgi:DNA-binding MarR family transcriptional regulator